MVNNSANAPSSQQFIIREGQATTDDFEAILSLLDGAVEWLTARGRSNQWGEQPWSAIPERCDRLRSIIGSPSSTIRLAVEKETGVAVGALVVGDKMDYAPEVAEPELYVKLLVTHRQYTGLGLGKKLLKEAEDVAREKGVSLMRVDCFGGGDRKLVAFYESAGFTPVQQFTVKDTWIGQLFERRIE